MTVSRHNQAWWLQWKYKLRTAKYDTVTETPSQRCDHRQQWYMFVRLLDTFSRIWKWYLFFFVAMFKLWFHLRPVTSTKNRNKPTVGYPVLSLSINHVCTHHCHEWRAARILPFFYETSHLSPCLFLAHPITLWKRMGGGVVINVTRKVIGQFHIRSSL